MNRRSLFRSLGLAAVVAGVSALPKAPQPAIPEGLPAFTKAKSEPLPEIHPVVGAIDWTGVTPRRWNGTVWEGLTSGYQIQQIIQNNGANNLYPIGSSGNRTTMGANHITFTNSTNLVMTTGAANPTTGYVQVEPSSFLGYVGDYGDRRVYEQADQDHPLLEQSILGNNWPLNHVPIESLEGYREATLSNGKRLWRGQDMSGWEEVVSA